MADGCLRLNLKDYLPTEKKKFKDSMVLHGTIRAVTAVPAFRGEP